MRRFFQLSVYPRIAVLVLCSLVGGLIASGAASAKDSSSEEAWWLDGSWPHEHSALKPHPDAVFGRLDNGLRYVLLHHESPKDRAALYLNIQVGSLMETDAQAGIAHYMEHMVFNGSRNFPPGELIKYFQSVGMSFGADANAHTGKQETVYKLKVPTTDVQSVEKGLVVLSDFLSGALITEEEVDSERGVILKEKTARDSEAFRSSQRRLRFLFPDTRFLNPTIGTEKIIEGADAALVRSFYDAWYRPELAVLIAVGDFDVQVMEPLLKKVFSSTQSRAERPHIPAWGDMNLKGVQAYYDRRPGMSGMIMVEAIKPRKHERDSLKVQHSMIADQLAIRMMQGRLLTLASRDNAPMLKSFAHMTETFGLMPNARIMAMPRKGQWDASLHVVENELRRALTFGFTEAELKQSKRFFKNYFAQAHKRELARNNSEIANEIVACMNQDRVYQSPAQTLELFSPMLAEISVAEVNKAFQSAWDSGNRIVGLTGVELKGNQSPQELILEVWNNAAKTDVVAWEDEPEVEFPYLVVPSKQPKVLKRFHDTAQAAPYTYHRTNFDNGLYLFMKPTEVEKDRVVLNLGFGPGTGAMDDSEQALARFSIDVLGHGGIGRLTRLQQSQVLAGRKMDIAWQINASGISLSVTCLRGDLETVMHLMRTGLVDPVVRENEFRSALAMLKNEDSRQAGTCSGVFASAGRRFLTGGAGYFAKLGYEQISGFALKEVQSFISKAFALGPLTMSVAGDFTTQDMEEKVGRFFGTLPARPHYEEKTVLLKFPVGQRAMERINRDLPQAGVTVAVPLPGEEGKTAGGVSSADFEEQNQLHLLCAIVFDRLRVTLREKLGVAYSPRAYMMESVFFPGFGYMAAQVETAAGKSEFVEQEIRSIFADLAMNGVTEEEFGRAKKQALSSRKKVQSRLIYWRYQLDTVARARSDQFARSAAVIDVLRSLKAEELSALAAKYFISENMAVFTVLPSKSN